MYAHTSVSGPSTGLEPLSQMWSHGRAEQCGTRQWVDGTEKEKTVIILYLNSMCTHIPIDACSYWQDSSLWSLGGVDDQRERTPAEAPYCRDLTGSGTHGLNEEGFEKVELGDEEGDNGSERLSATATVWVDGCKACKRRSSNPCKLLSTMC